MIISNTKLNNACLISVRVVIGKFGDILKKQRVEVNFINKGYIGRWMRILLLRRRTITNHRNRRWGLEWGFYSDFNSLNNQWGLLKHISSNIKAQQQTKTSLISAYPAFKTKDWINTCRMKRNQKVTPLMNRGYNNLSLTVGVYRKSWVIYLRNRNRLWKLNLLTIPNNDIIMINNYLLTDSISKLLVGVRYRIYWRGNIVSLRHKKYSLATNKKT